MHLECWYFILCNSTRHWPCCLKKQNNVIWLLWIFAKFIGMLLKKKHCMHECLKQAKSIISISKGLNLTYKTFHHQTWKSLVHHLDCCCLHLCNNIRQSIMYIYEKKLICLIWCTCTVKQATIHYSSGRNVFMYSLNYNIHEYATRPRQVLIWCKLWNW